MGLYSKWPMSTAFSEILTLQFSTYFIMIHVFSSLQYSNFLQSFQDSWDVNGLCSCKTFLDFCNEIRIDFAFLQKFLNSGDRFSSFLRWNHRIPIIFLKIFIVNFYLYIVQIYNRSLNNDYLKLYGIFLVKFLCFKALKQ